MDEKDPAGPKETLKSLLNSTQRNHSYAASLNKSSLSRFVWFVAISGFGLTFSWQFLDRIGIEQLPTPVPILVSVPWLLAAILSILAHFAVDEMVRFDSLAVAAKISLIELSMIDLDRGKDVTEQAISIINDNHHSYRDFVANSNVWLRIVNFFERFALIALLISFVLVPIVLFTVTNFRIPAEETFFEPMEFNLNGLGLVFDIVGAFLLLKFNLPSRLDLGGPDVITTEGAKDNTELVDLRMYRLWSNIGWGLVLIGFALQLISSI